MIGRILCCGDEEVKTLDGGALDQCAAPAAAVTSNARMANNLPLSVQRQVDAVRNGTSSEIDAGEVELGATGLAALEEALRDVRVRQSLQRLALANSKFGNRGAAALADALRYATQLQRLDLRRNRIGPEGAAALAGALRHATQLQRLNLTRNFIGPEGATALADAPTLRCTTSPTTRRQAPRRRRAHERASAHPLQQRHRRAAALAGALAHATQLQSLNSISANCSASTSEATASAANRPRPLQQRRRGPRRRAPTRDAAAAPQPHPQLHRPRRRHGPR